MYRLYPIPSIFSDDYLCDLADAIEDLEEKNMVDEISDDTYEHEVTRLTARVEQYLRTLRNEADAHEFRPLSEAEFFDGDITDGIIMQARNGSDQSKSPCQFLFDGVTIVNIE